MLDPTIVATSVKRFRDADKLRGEDDGAVPAICPARNPGSGARGFADRINDEFGGRVSMISRVRR